MNQTNLKDSWIILWFGFGLLGLPVALCKQNELIHNVHCMWFPKDREVRTEFWVHMVQGHVVSTVFNNNHIVWVLCHSSYNQVKNRVILRLVEVCHGDWINLLHNYYFLLFSCVYLDVVCILSINTSWLNTCKMFLTLALHNW